MLFRTLVTAMCINAVLLGCPAKAPAPDGQPGAASMPASGPASAPASQPDAMAHHNHGPPKPAPKGLKQDAAEMLVDVQNKIDAHRAFLLKKPKNAMMRGRLMSYLSVKGRLTGTLEPYGEALKVGEQALKDVVEGAGPQMEYAAAAGSLHKNKLAAKALEHVIAYPILRAETAAGALAQQAGIAWQAGKIDEAERLITAAIDKSDDASVLTHRANMEADLGNLDAARKTLEIALANTVRKFGMGIAFLYLRRGILDLDVGDLDNASAWFAKADAAFEDWYLVKEHQAEILHLRGKLDEAEAAYRTIIATTDNPEFKDALADVLIEQGTEKSKTEAKRWRKEATAAYEKMIAAYPEAAYGHAVGHFIEVDPKRAVKLAERDYADRPGGAQAARLISAHVALAKGAAAPKAIALADTVSKTRFSSIAFLEAARDAYRAASLPDKARAMDSRLKKMGAQRAD